MAEHGTDVRSDLTSPLEEAQVRELREKFLNLEKGYDTKFAAGWLAEYFVALCDSWLAQRDVVAAAREAVLLLRHPGPRSANSANQVLNKLECALAAAAPVPSNEEKE